MTAGVFEHNMDMLAAAIMPYRWNTKNAGAYWKALEYEDDKVFADTCNRLLYEEHDNKMPSIHRLKQEMGSNKAVARQACHRCDKGRMHFDVLAENGMLYERYAACDHCDAGQGVMRHMALLDKRRAQENGHIHKSAPEGYYGYEKTRLRLATALIEHDHTKPVSDVWEVDLEAQGYTKAEPDNSFIKAIAQAKSGAPWDMQLEKDSFEKVEDYSGNRQ